MQIQIVDHLILPVRFYSRLNHYLYFKKYVNSFLIQQNVLFLRISISIHTDGWTPLGLRDTPGQAIAHFSRSSTSVTESPTGKI